MREQVPYQHLQPILFEIVEGSNGFDDVIQIEAGTGPVVSQRRGPAQEAEIVEIVREEDNAWGILFGWIVPGAVCCGFLYLIGIAVVAAVPVFVRIGVVVGEFLVYALAGLIFLFVAWQLFLVCRRQYEQEKKPDLPQVFHREQRGAGIRVNVNFNQF